MQTKTYFASNVPAALEVARKELGEEAMLLNSKPASEAARPFGRLEVTFAYEAKPAAALFAKAGESRRGMSDKSNPGKGASEKPTSELEEIRQQLSALTLAVGRPAGKDLRGASVAGCRAVGAERIWGGFGAGDRGGCGNRRQPRAGVGLAYPGRGISRAQTRRG